MVKTLVRVSCLLLPLSIYPPHGCISPYASIRYVLKRLAAVLIFAPLFRMFTANEWWAQFQLICLSIPALFTQRLTDLQQLSYVGKSNIKQLLSAGASPIMDNRPSFKGITTPLLAECPLVLLCSNFNNRLA